MNSEFLFIFDHANVENVGLFCSTLHKHNCFTLRFMGVISTFCTPFRSLSEPTFSTLNNFSGNFASEILQTDFRSLLLNRTLYVGFLPSFCHNICDTFRKRQKKRAVPAPTSEIQRKDCFPFVRGRCFYAISYKAKKNQLALVPWHLQWESNP